MPNVEWSTDIERAAFRLPAAARADLLRTVAALRHLPEIGRMVATGRYRGCRRLTIGKQWHLFYRVVGEERTCRLVAIRDARRRPV